jgi:putative membrane protein
VTATRFPGHLAAVLAFAVVIPAHAAPSASDTEFMKKAAQAGTMEIEASKMAQQQASDSAVKDFAARMVKDHQAAADELKQLASRKKVALPATPDASDRATLDALKGLNGTAFDRRYADSVGVQAHMQAVDLFRQASQSASDTDVKSFASKTLPTLEHHLDMARNLAAKNK